MMNCLRVKAPPQGWVPTLEVAGALQHASVASQRAGRALHEAINSTEGFDWHL